MLIFDSTSYAGSFGATGSGSGSDPGWGAFTFTVAALGPLSATIALAADGAVSGTWSFSGTAKLDISASGGSSTENLVVGGGGTVSGTPDALVFVGSDFLVSGTGHLSADDTSVFAVFAWSAGGASGAANGTFLGAPSLIADIPPPDPLPVAPADVPFFETPAILALPDGGVRYTGPRWTYTSDSGGGYNLAPGGAVYANPSVIDLTAQAMTDLAIIGDVHDLPEPFQQVLATGGTALKLADAIKTLVEDELSIIANEAAWVMAGHADLDTVQEHLSDAVTKLKNSLSDMVADAYLDATLKAVCGWLEDETLNFAKTIADHITLFVSNPKFSGSAQTFTVQTGASPLQLPNLKNNMVIGSSSDDTIKGGSWSSLVLAGAGNDLITGGASTDRLNGGPGNDRMFGRAGDDTYYINSTGDRVYESTTPTSGIDSGGIDTVRSRISLSLDAYSGIRFVEHLVLTGSDNINATGNSRANTITGNSGANIIKGGAGADSLNGGLSSDSLWGGDGDDALDGGSGNDRLIGDAGADTLTGRLGHDRFVYNALTDSKGANADTITDFSHAQGDLIDLHMLDAVAGGANDAFTLVSAFTHAAGQLVISGSGGAYTVDGDTNGDGTADFTVHVSSASALTAGDFVL